MRALALECGGGGGQRWYGLAGPLSQLFSGLAEARASLENLLLHGSPALLQESVTALAACRQAVHACLAWRGANDRERSVRAVSENALGSCLDAIRMAELGIQRNRRDMVEAASRNLAIAHERLALIARSITN